MLAPKRVPLKGVRCIAAGAAHTLAVTDDAVYSWGHGQCGALGHGTYEDKALPTRIKALLGKDIERVGAGQHHTLFLRRCVQPSMRMGCSRRQHPLASLVLDAHALAPSSQLHRAHVWPPAQNCIPPPPTHLCHCCAQCTGTASCMAAAAARWARCLAACTA